MRISATEIGVLTSAAGDHSWYPLVVEILAASVIFVIIIAIAVVIFKVIAWAEKNKVSPVVIFILKAADLLVFSVDVLAYVCYVVVKAWVELIHPLWELFRSSIT